MSACRAKRTKDYPLLCMSNHGRWRMHAQCDDITWTREVETMKIPLSGRLSVRARLDAPVHGPCARH